MATIQDRPFSRDYSGLKSQSVLASGIITLCVTSYEIMKRRRRGRKRDEPLGSVESWQFGYLYQGRSWAKNPSPPHPRGWPLAWVKSVIMFPEAKLHELRGVDAALYCRFIRGCFWFVLTHTCTTTAVLLPIHLEFSSDEYSPRSMNRALISSLVGTDKGLSLLWVHLCLLLWVTVSWVLTLLWIIRGTLRFRRTEAEYALQRVEQELAEKRAQYYPHPHPQHPFHDVPPVDYDQSNRGLRLRTVMVTNVPTRLRSEKELREYFEYYMSRPILKPSIGLTSSTQPGLINKLVSMLINRIRRSKLFSSDKEAQVEDPDEDSKEMEELTGKGCKPSIQRIVIARKMTELASLLERREDVLNKLETAHIRLARRALEAVKDEMDRREFGPSRHLRFTQGIVNVSNLFSKKGGTETPRSSGDAVLQTDFETDGEEDEAESRMDLLVRTLGPFVEQFGVRNQRPFLRRRFDDFRHYTYQLLSYCPVGPFKAISLPPLPFASKKAPLDFPSDPHTGPNHPTIWDALFSLPRPTLDAYQPLIHLSALFRGRTVPAIDYYTTKVKLLTSLIAENRSRPLTDLEPVSTAFVTFSNPEDARRACKYLAVHPKNPLACFVTMAPEYEDLDWVRVMKSTFRAEIVKDWVIDVGVWAFTIIWVIPVSLLVALVTIKNIAVVIPGLLDFLNRSPYLLEIISSLLPTLFTSLLMLLIPLLLLLIAKKAHTFNTLSALHDKIMTRYHKFLVANIFVFFCVGVSTLESFFTSLKSTIDILTTVGESFPSAGPFYVGWFIFTTSIHAGTELLLFGLPLFVYPSTKRQITPRKRAIGIRPRTFNYYYWLPNHVLVVILTLVFAVLNPLLTPFALLYFIFENVVIKNQLLHVYAKNYEGNGNILLIRIVRYTLDGMVLAQVCFLGFAGVAKKEIHVALTAVIIAFTVVTKLVLTRIIRAKFERIEVLEARKVCGVDQQLANTPPTSALLPENPNEKETKPKGHSNDGGPTVAHLLNGDSVAEKDDTLVNVDPHDPSSPRYRAWKLPHGLAPNLERGYSFSNNDLTKGGGLIRGNGASGDHKPIPSAFTKELTPEKRALSWNGKDDAKDVPGGEKSKTMGSMPNLRNPYGFAHRTDDGLPTPDSPSSEHRSPTHSRPMSPSNDGLPTNKPLLVTPHPPHSAWDDTLRLDHTYDNPYYTRPITNWMWLPRDPAMLGKRGGDGKGGWLDLDDTVRVWRALTSDIGGGGGGRHGGRLGEVVGGGDGEGGLPLDGDFDALDMGIGADGAIMVDDADIPTPIGTTPSGSEEDLTAPVRPVDPDRLSVGTPPMPTHSLHPSPRLVAIASSHILTSEPEPISRTPSVLRLTGNEEISLRPTLARRITNLSRQDDIDVAREGPDVRSRSSISLPMSVYQAVEAFKGSIGLKRPSTAGSRRPSNASRPGQAQMQTLLPASAPTNGPGSASMSLGLGRPSTFNVLETDPTSRQVSGTSMSASSTGTQRRAASLLSQLDEFYGRGRNRTVASRAGRGRAATLFTDPAAMPDLHAQARFVRSRTSLISDGGISAIGGGNNNSLAPPSLFPLSQTYSRSTNGTARRVRTQNHSHSRSRTRIAAAVAAANRPRSGSTTTRASNVISTREAVVGEVIAEEVQATEERLRREEREAVSSSEIVRVSPGLAAVADGEINGNEAGLKSVGKKSGRSWLTAWMYKTTNGDDEEDEMEERQREREVVRSE